MPGVRRADDAGAMSASSDLPRPAPLTVVAMSAAVALCWFSGLMARGYHLSIGDGPFRGDYLTVTGTGLATATVLALGLLALAVLRAPWWVALGEGAGFEHH